MNKKEVEELLDALTSAHMEVAYVEAEKKKLIDSVITKEIREQLEAIDEELDPQIEKLKEKANELEAEVREQTIRFGGTVKNDVFMAVYNKPRISWDNKMLEGFLLAYPQLSAARKPGKPSVAIRRVK